eukprot:scaffold876_cov243-Pinguiococcus_pyrenoidosus.AAC.29
MPDPCRPTHAPGEVRQGTMAKVDCIESTASCRLEDWRPSSAPGTQRSTVHSQQSTASSPQPAVHSQQSTASSQQPYCNQQPAARRQVATSNQQPAAKLQPVACSQPDLINARTNYENRGLVYRGLQLSWQQPVSLWWRHGWECNIVILEVNGVSGSRLGEQG